MSLTVASCREKKERLELDIAALVQQFTLETGLSVRELQVDEWPPQESELPGGLTCLVLPVGIRATVEL